MKVKGKILTIALLLSLIFSISAVAAQEDMTFDQSEIQSVESETDLGISPEDTQTISGEIDEDTTPIGEVENQKLGETVSGDNFTSIQDAINSASSGSTIFLDGKTYKATSTIDVDKDGITIIGGSSADDDAVATLDGEGRIQIMKVTASNVVIKGIKFINAEVSGTGGAILWSAANGVLKDSTFINNHATKNGGAIYWDNVNASVEKCHFENNTASGDGAATAAAIYFNGTNATIKDSKFINNTANYGGAVHIDKDNSQVDGCIFDNNHAVYREAGALRWFGSYGKLTNSKFTNNTAANHAGALYLHTANINITRCSFKGSVATSNGGAIYSNAANVLVSDSNFTGNMAVHGGAILFNKAECTVNNCIFSSNIAEKYAGAIMFDTNSANSRLFNSKFENNVAENNIGGAIQWKSINGVASSCEFINNFAAQTSGALRVEGINFNLTNSNFTGNRAGGSDAGAVYWTSKGGELKNCNFVNNTATGNGGALYILSSVGEFTLSNSRFTKNTAKTYGGAVVSYNSDGKIIGCNFTDNIADNGGALHFDGNNKVVSNCIFINNTGRVNGGAVRAGGINVNNTTIKGCVFTNNSLSSAGAGGAILWYGFNSVISDCKFTNNSAYYGGAINLETNAKNYFMESRNTTIIDCEFVENKADYGGAVRWLGLEGKLISSNFTNNSVGYAIGTSSQGGALNVHSLASNMTVSNSIFNNNSAKGNGGDIYWDAVDGCVEKSNFTGASSNYGGSIYWRGANGELTESKFADAYALNNGGAVHWAGVNATVSDSIFERNYADAFAGSILFTTAAINARVRNSKFTNNVAGTSTAGIRCEGADADVSNCIFINNTALTGGSAAFYVHASDCKLSDSKFINNTAATDAGAVLWNSKGFNGSLTNCEFVNNSANRDGGGLMWNCPGGILKNATFSNNSAEDGGAIFWSGDDAQVSDCKFTDNKANLTAGAVILKGNNGNLSNCEFTNNSAGTLSGGLYWYSSYGNVTNCSFTGNSAGTNNGAMGINSGATDVSVSDCSFTNNKAGDLGGAFHWNGPNGKLDNCTFTNNTAVDGGASYWNGEGGAMNNCTFTNNTAASSGAIHWRGNNGNINGSTFTGNSAEIGGAIHTTADGLTITQNDFVNNTGVYAGSALWIDGDNNQIIANDIVSDGSGMVSTYVTDSKNTVFEANTGDVNVHSAQVIMELADVFVGYVGRTLTIPIYIHDDLGVPLSGEVTIQDWGAKQLVGGRANFTIEMPQTEQLMRLLVYYEKINRNVEIDVVDPSDAIDDIVQPERMGKDEIIIELPVDAKGNVTVTVGGKNYTANVVNGTAVIEFNDLKNGVYSAKVYYSGDGVYDNMTKEFNLTIKYSSINPQTSLLGNKDVSVIYSGSGTYKVLVFKYGKLVGAGESVTFNFNGKNTVVKTDAGSYATFRFTANAEVKTHTIKATYFGTTVTNKVKVTQIIKASDKKVKKSAKVTKIKITLNKVNGKYLKSKTLKIKFNKKTYKVKTNKKGVATWKVKKSMLKKLKVGKKVKYTVTYGKATLTKKLTIKK